jgi:PAS domain-containing protein
VARHAVHHRLGHIGEDAAVEAMKAGAHDYVPKDNLARLAPVVERALRDAEQRRQRRRAQEALREAEEKYRGIFENAVEGIFQTSTDGRMVTANPMMARIFGTTPPRR